MNALPTWEARAILLAEIASTMRSRRIARVAHRLTKPDCYRCGGEDYVHAMGCTRRGSYRSAAIAFGNAVIRAAAKHAVTVRENVIMAQLHAAFPGGVR